MNFSKGFWDQFKGKKVVLYGADVSGFAFLYWADKADVNVAYFVDRNNEKQKMLIMGKEVKAPIELMYENSDEIKIVITAPGGKDSIVKTLTEMGFRCDKHIVTEFVDNRLGSKHRQVDILLGTSRGDEILYEMKKKNPDDEMLIMVVGGSTTDPLYEGINSWSFYLQEVIDNNGIAARVVNVAECGYTSSQELLVLLRDGLAVNPDVVISYSGWNDVSPAADIEKGKRYAYTSRNLYLTFDNLVGNCRGEPFGDVYYGKLESSAFERYITNMRLMHAMCVEFNCKFYGLLQPSLASIPIELLQSSFAKSVARDSLMTNMREKWDDFYNKYLARKSVCNYLYDFTHILNGHDDVFEDPCHVNDDGNRIIAENVFALLVEQKAFGQN